MTPKNYDLTTCRKPNLHFHEIIKLIQQALQYQQKLHVLPIKEKDGGNCQKDSQQAQTILNLPLKFEIVIEISNSQEERILVLKKT